MSTGKHDQPELIVSRGHVYTVDGADDARAEAFAVAHGRILAVGTAEEIETLRRPSTRFIDLEGATVLPGMSDSHTHFLEGAVSYGVELADVTSREQFRQRVKAAVEALPRGEWLVGGFWNEELWGGPLPHRSWIDDLSPDNPVMLHRQDIHSALLNSAALATVGLDDSSTAPSGGKILKDADGRLTGILVESALVKARYSIPEPSLERIRAAHQYWMKRANAVGITHICDFVRTPEEFGIHLDLERDGILTCRFDVVPLLSNWERFARAGGTRTGVGLELVRLGAFKAFLDGSLGTRTARMFEPYSDDPGNTGLYTPEGSSTETLLAALICADRAGFQLAVHAIGDAANRYALDLFEKVRAGSPNPNLRHRIEHAQHIHPDDLPRYGKLRLIASMQPYHFFGETRFAEERIGKERCRWAYPCRSLADAGAMLVFSSDWPVVPLNPIFEIAAAVTRASADGRYPDGWIPEEKITVPEAVAASTRNAAICAGQEHRWGRIAPGLDADFVILERDIFECDTNEIASTEVRETYLRGRRVYPEEG